MRATEWVPPGPMLGRQVPFKLLGGPLGLQEGCVSWAHLPGFCSATWDQTPTLIAQ